MTFVKFTDVGTPVLRDCHEAIAIRTSPNDNILKYACPLDFKSLKALSINNCVLRGRDLVAFKNWFLPANDIWPHYRRVSPAGKLRQVLSLCVHRTETIEIRDGVLCSLASHPSWEKNIFHWFIDILPRIFAAETVSSNCQPVRLIKPGSLEAWQIDSLECLGYGSDAIITTPDVESISICCASFAGLVGHRRFHAKGLPDFSIHPYIINQLKTRLNKFSGMHRKAFPARIIIFRHPSVGRSFLNMSDIHRFAAYHGFSVLDLANLSLKDQISIFNQSSHIIAAHGAGLTNLIHCSQAAVLEIHCSKHGIRSEYFQIAAINNLRYFYHVCSAANEQADMVIDIKVLESFIRQTSD